MATIRGDEEVCPTEPSDHVEFARRPSRGKVPPSNSLQDTYRCTVLQPPSSSRTDIQVCEDLSKCANN